MHFIESTFLSSLSNKETVAPKKSQAIVTFTFAERHVLCSVRGAGRRSFEASGGLTLCQYEHVTRNDN
jgi:hypothetical protein